MSPTNIKICIFKFYSVTFVLLASYLSGKNILSASRVRLEIRPICSCWNGINLFALVEREHWLQ